MSDQPQTIDLNQATLDVIDVITNYTKLVRTLGVELQRLQKENADLRARLADLPHLQNLPS